MLSMLSGQSLGDMKELTLVCAVRRASKNGVNRRMRSVLQITLAGVFQKMAPSLGRERSYGAGTLHLAL